MKWGGLILSCLGIWRGDVASKGLIPTHLNDETMRKCSFFHSLSKIPHLYSLSSLPFPTNDRRQLLPQIWSSPLSLSLSHSLSPLNLSHPLSLPCLFPGDDLCGTQAAPVREAAHGGRRRGGGAATTLDAAAASLLTHGDGARRWTVARGRRLRAVRRWGGFLNSNFFVIILMSSWIQLDYISFSRFEFLCDCGLYLF